MIHTIMPTVYKMVKHRLKSCSICYINKNTELVTNVCFVLQETVTNFSKARNAYKEKQIHLRRTSKSLIMFILFEIMVKMDLGSCSDA